MGKSREDSLPALKLSVWGREGLWWARPKLDWMPLSAREWSVITADKNVGHVEVWNSAHDPPVFPAPL